MASAENAQFGEQQRIGHVIATELEFDHLALAVEVRVVGVSSLRRAGDGPKSAQLRR